VSLKKSHSVLEVKDLSIGYFLKKEQILISKEINFSIPKGELVSIVGINGIGKSTLLRTLANMQPALNGIVYLNNKNVSDYSSFQLANTISIVLTEAPSSKNLSVLELITLGRHPYTNWIGTLSENDKKIIQNAIDITEIEDLVNYKCMELSDGQLQRVMIARALAQDTPLILLDEPTTHLDIYHRAYLLKLLKKLAVEKQKTILFSTQEIDLAIQVSNKMIVMTKDKVHFDQPNKLIELGCFNTLFPSETIEFNKDLKRFILKD
jgi:iron complex transport system ATP-binding protein